MNEIQKKTARRIQELLSASESDPSFGIFASACRENEAFYLGHQWRDGEGGDLTKPVFNVTKQVCDYIISSLCNKEYTISYTLDGAPPALLVKKGVQEAVETLEKHIGFIADKETLEKLIFSLTRDAVIYGSGILYSCWDPNKETGEAFKGAFETRALDPTALFPSDPKDPNVQSQDYFLIRGSASVSALRREAKLHGRSEEDIKKIVSEDDGVKAEFTLLLERNSDNGHIHFAKESCGILVSEGDTGMTLYPIAVFTPTPKSGSFFGEPICGGLIPNQRYINRSYCMLMKHMQDTAFSKVIYDKTKIPEWTGEAGIAIGAHGGGNLSDAVAVVGCGELSDGYVEFSSKVMELTKELYGATEVALGNVEPTNTSAIMAAREAAMGQLRGSVIQLTSAIEEQARIWAEMVCIYYGKERYIPTEKGIGARGIDFSAIKSTVLKCRVDVSDLSKFGTSVSLAVLDKLLESGAITPAQYLKRLPDGIVHYKESLIAELEKSEVHENKTEEGKE